MMIKTIVFNDGVAHDAGMVKNYCNHLYKFNDISFTYILFSLKIFCYQLHSKMIGLEPLIGLEFSSSFQSL